MAGQTCKQYTQRKVKQNGTTQIPKKNDKTNISKTEKKEYNRIAAIYYVRYDEVEIMYLYIQTKQKSLRNYLLSLQI